MGAGLEWYEVVGRLLLASALGGALGIEREYGGQDAGFRTHLLVVLGSALFGLASVGGFDAFVSSGTTNVQIDVTRIAAYVAPGIGFIGGGAILKYGGRVTGITTAASLWTASAIGVAAGLGFWSAAVATTAIALVALELLRPVSRAARRVGQRRRAALALDLADGADLGAVVGVVRELAGNRIRSLRYGVGPDDGAHLTVELWTPLPAELMEDLVVRLGAVEGVDDVWASRLEDGDTG